MNEQKKEIIWSKPHIMGHYMAGISSPEAVHRLLNTHVEARLLHAAVKLELLAPLREQPYTAESLADLLGLTQRGVRVLLAGLSGLGVIHRHNSGTYKLTPWGQTMGEPDRLAEIAQAGQFWQAATQPEPALLTTLVKRAAGHQIPIVAQSWGYVWTVVLMELAAAGIPVRLAEQPCSLAELARQVPLPTDDLAALLSAGQACGVLTMTGKIFSLTEAAQIAFGKGRVAQPTRWTNQRLQMERHYFWPALTHLADCVQTGRSPYRHSAAGDGDSFRQTFIRVNRPLLPLLRLVARQVVEGLGLHRRPLTVLELGSGLGQWGSVLAEANEGSRITAVDVPPALAETKRIIAALTLADRYTWQPGYLLDQTFAAGPYDLILINEIGHTLPPTQLAAWLGDVSQALKAEGLLLLTDMVLHDNLTGPFRYLLADIKLLVTGGGQLLPAATYCTLLQQAGLAHTAIYYLPTTCLIAAGSSHPLPAAIAGYIAHQCLALQ